MRHLISVLLFLPLLTAAQRSRRAGFSIKDYDWSLLWRADSIFAQDEGTKVAFPEPLGYIGDNFQRFWIHYISVRKSKTDSRVYEVTGKTMVRDNICPFTGTISIMDLYLRKDSDLPPYEEGTVTCAIRFFEDSTHPGSGSITGTLTTDFCIDAKGRLQYDAIMAAADGYSNNQATARWKSYKSGITKKCNWGDYRIPDSKDLDGGAGEFTVDEKYVKNGWESYYKAYIGDDPEKKKYQAIEDRQWWKE